MPREMSPTYQPGEVVDILIEDARVVLCRDGALVFSYDGVPFGHARASIEYEAKHVSIKRIQPAEQPRPGELWQDGGGRRWLAASIDDSATGSSTVRLFGPGAGPAGMEVSFVHQNAAPLTPIYQEGGPS